MKYCRFISPDGPQYGLIEDQTITQITVDGAIPDFSRARKVAPIPLSSATLVAPVQPSKIVCVGRNYADHAKEFGN